jgi:hypothetical protein
MDRHSHIVGKEPVAFGGYFYWLLRRTLGDAMSLNHRDQRG